MHNAANRRDSLSRRPTINAGFVGGVNSKSGLRGLSVASGEMFSSLKLQKVGANTARKES